MELVSCSSNGHKVLLSGSVVGFENNPSFTFELSDKETNFNFKIIMDFVEDEKKEKTEAETTVDTEKNEVKVKCINFNNDLGTGLTNAVEIATIGGKKIFWRYICTKMSSLPVLSYSIYEE